MAWYCLSFTTHPAIRTSEPKVSLSSCRGKKGHAAHHEEVRVFDPVRGLGHPIVVGQPVRFFFYSGFEFHVFIQVPDVRGMFEIASKLRVAGEPLCPGESAPDGGI